MKGSRERERVSQCDKILINFSNIGSDVRGLLTHILNLKLYFDLEKFKNSNFFIEIDVRNFIC